MHCKNRSSFHGEWIGILVIPCLFSLWFTNGPRQANLVLIAYASSEGSGEPAHPRSLARTSAARSYKRWVNLQTESQIPGPWHTQLKFVMTECSKTQIRLTRPKCGWQVKNIVKTNSILETLPYYHLCKINWASSSQFVSSSIPSWQILTVHAQPFKGPGIWFSVWRFLLTHCLYERAVKVLARLCGCAGSPEPSLLE